jgi:hypothetical protein
MTVDPRARFDRLLKAMLSGPPASARKRDEQPQSTQKRDSEEKPEVQDE